MFFGGINGFNRFHPDSIKDNLHVSPVAVTAFKKFDEVVRLAGMEEIELSHEDNFFSLEFAVLDYANPAKNQYAYRLEGFDKNWIHSRTRRVASYTNLDPGRYTFRVKGANNDGIWNDVGAAVAITIHPPFWKTWWFRLLAAGALAATALLIHNFRVQQKVAKTLEIEQARKAENERLRKQVADDFHDEFGQQLTNIALFAEIIKRRLNGAAPQTLAHLNKIGDAAKSLSDSMRDFIWTLDRNKDSLYSVSARLKDFGETLFAKSEIRFEAPGLSLEWERVPLSMDWKRHLVQIFKEAMKNSRKHAACSRVGLKITIKGQTLHMRLADDGKGFDPSDDSASGSGLRYMKKRAAKIRGELQIVSQPGHGAEIQFKGRLV
jgi:signal transduction histidine kinase